MASDSLPPEIWFAIVNHLPRGDQLRISQVSSQLCSLARKVIYLEVDLRSDNIAVETTLALLTRDHSIARNVRRLHIYTTAGATLEPTWFDPVVLASMMNLCELDLTGMPFATEEDQLKFNNAVSESLLALRKLTYRVPYPIRMSDPDAPLSALLIGGLQEFTWIDSGAFKPPLHILIPINASRETLTHIRIPVPTIHLASYPPLIQFFSLRFPRLSTLHIGGWETVVPAGTALANFLVDHPLIEDLHLGFSDTHARGLHCHVFPDVTLSPGTLPNLRRLAVDAFNLGVFVRSRISSLQTLESLRIDVGHFEDGMGREDGFAEVYRELEAYGGLPGLKALELGLEGLTDHLENASWTAGFGKLCPKIERFWGDYEVGQISYNGIFAPYCNLKSLVMPGEELKGLSEQERMNYAKHFAASNPSVTELLFYLPDDEESEEIHFRVARDAEGKITDIVELLKNGDH